MAEEFYKELLLMENYCNKNKIIFFRKSFIVLFKELKEKNLLHQINDSFLEILNLFSIGDKNIISLIRLLLLQEDYYYEDAIGFYYTINYYINNIYPYKDDFVNKLKRFSPKFAFVMEKQMKFSDNLPLNLKAKYGLAIKNVIINYIIYNTYVKHKDNIDDLLLDTINDQNVIIDRLTLFGLNNYYQINHNYDLICKYYWCIEMFFNSYSDKAYQKIID